MRNPRVPISARRRAARCAPTRPKPSGCSGAPCATVACRRSNFAGGRRSVLYIVDFLCIARRLIVEADGSQRAESRYHAARQAWLAEQGYAVLRFSDRDVLMARESVLATIAARCGLPW